MELCLMHRPLVSVYTAKGLREVRYLVQMISGKIIVGLRALAVNVITRFSW